MLAVKRKGGRKMQIGRITAEWLRQQDVAPEHVRDFQRKWPDELELTEVNLLRVLEEWGLDPDWFASRILSGPAQEAYENAEAAAREAYDEVNDAAYEAYEKATAPAQEAYERAEAAANEEFRKALDSANEAYRKKAKLHDLPGWEAYEKNPTLETSHKVMASITENWRATAPAAKAEWKAKDSAREAHGKATDLATAAYKKATGPARQAYEKAEAAAREAYDKAKARALAAIIKGERGFA